MRMGWVRASPALRVPSRRMEAPLRPALSTLFEPSFAVKVPEETSRQRAESESNSQPGLRSHIALMRGFAPMAVRVALPNASAFGASRLKRKAPLLGITAFPLAA